MAGEILLCRPPNLRLQKQPQIFDMLSEAVCWILSNNYAISPPHPPPRRFLSRIASRRNPCRPHPHSPKGFFRAWDPHRSGKTMGPATSIEFLGINLDSVKFQVSLPKEKIDRIILVSSSLIDSSRCSNANSCHCSGHLNSLCALFPKVVLSSRISSYSLPQSMHSRTHFPIPRMQRRTEVMDHVPQTMEWPFPLS